MTKLIINADDFGIHSAVNDGIIRGHKRGIITSTSLLAGGQAFEEAVQLAKEEPNLGIGAHICLVGGLPPVASPQLVPSLLTEEGVFPDTYITLLKWLYTGRIQIDQLELEIQAQFNKIMASGLSITHVDGHQHMHILPQVLPIIIKYMNQYDLHRIRIPKESYTFINGVYNPIRLLGKMGLSFVSTLAKSKIENYKFLTTDYFWGMINGGQLRESALEKILRRVASYGGVHEIMTHPGISNDILNQSFHWQYHWEEELSGMLSFHMQRLVKEKHIQLINYGDL